MDDIKFNKFLKGLKIRKAWKVYNKKDDYYVQCCADNYYADNRSLAKRLYLDANFCDSYIDVVAKRDKTMDEYYYKNNYRTIDEIKDDIKYSEYNNRLKNLKDDEYYYIQDNRSFTGNCIIFWRKGFCGYTSDIDNALIIKGSEAKLRHWRYTDIFWETKYMDKNIKRVIDIQDINNNKSF